MLYNIIMLEELFKQIAKYHAVLPDKALADMQTALDKAFEQGNPSILKIPRKGDKPTTMEFLRHIAWHILLEDELNKL